VNTGTTKGESCLGNGTSETAETANTARVLNFISEDAKGAVDTPTEGAQEHLAWLQRTRREVASMLQGATLRKKKKRSSQLHSHSTSIAPQDSDLGPLDTAAASVADTHAAAMHSAETPCSLSPMLAAPSSMALGDSSDSSTAACSSLGGATAQLASSPHSTSSSLSSSSSPSASSSSFFVWTSLTFSARLANVCWPPNWLLALVLRHRRRSAQGAALLVAAVAVAVAIARKSRVQMATLRRVGIAAGIASAAATLQRHYTLPDKKHGATEHPPEQPEDAPAEPCQQA